MKKYLGLKQRSSSSSCLVPEAVSTPRSSDSQRSVTAVPILSVRASITHTPVSTPVRTPSAYTANNVQNSFHQFDRKLDRKLDLIIENQKTIMAEMKRIAADVASMKPSYIDTFFCNTYSKVR